MKLPKSVRAICVIRGLLLLTVLCLLIPVFCSSAQCTSSNWSNGFDGNFNPTNSMPNTGWSFSNDVATGRGIVTVTNKPDGVFNFGTIYIETNWVVKFTRNTLNTPVFLLASNDVTIKGTINVRGGDQAAPAINGGQGGPGGFDGGTGAIGSSPRGGGFGPGGGDSSWYYGGSFGSVGGGSNPGKIYGTIDLQPMIGGSGGSGGDPGYGGGSGGGGAILIASSTKIDVSGTITADGGAANLAGCAAGGSGGGIRLVANTIQGEGLISAIGGSACGAFGGDGRIRLEACNNNRISFTQPAATFGTPGSVFLKTNSTIRVTSIAGTNTPAIPAGSLTSPDVYLPTNNPAVISVSASNINPGTLFNVIIVPTYGTNMIASSTLAGTYAFTTGVVTMAVYTDRVWRVNALIDYIPRP
jgi:hypothetical protein